jgi:hypothetical protein
MTSNPWNYTIRSFFNNLIWITSRRKKFWTTSCRFGTGNKFKKCTPNIIFLTLINISYLINTINKLKYLTTNQPVISIQINYNITILTKIHISNMSIVKSTSIISVENQSSALFYRGILI